MIRPKDADERVWVLRFEELGGASWINCLSLGKIEPRTLDEAVEEARASAAQYTSLRLYRRITVERGWPGQRSPSICEQQMLCLMAHIERCGDARAKADAAFIRSRGIGGEYTGLTPPAGWEPCIAAVVEVSDGAAS